MDNTQHHDHVKRDAALGAGAGALGGHEAGHGHTGRDAAIGAGAAGLGEHELKKHDQHNPVAGGNPVSRQEARHDQHKVNERAEGKVPLGDKIKGTAKEAEGKLTGNQAKVAEGKALKDDRAL
ncbi:hypothetical protein INT43_004250 [Umbelopsis isabellina]|uniref:CsbD-like domain-containing protein n=1 Tax=Mortierella isabellina TaxID=91625 RepID=A0A8H7PIK3_MORIS|nr:hypothetical protein INT43_004250 [Umbelopsis isabellina]